MADETPLKSAYELAMERLRARDRDTGTPEQRPWTATEKRRIAELRRTAEAKLAELEILHRDRQHAVADDPDKLRKLEEHYAIDRRRVEAELESAIARLRTKR